MPKINLKTKTNKHNRKGLVNLFQYFVMWTLYNKKKTVNSILINPRNIKLPIAEGTLLCYLDWSFCACGHRCLALPHVSRFGKWTQTTPSSNSRRLRPIHGLRWVNRYRSTVLLLLAQPPSTSSPQLDSSSWLHFIHITRLHHTGLADIIVLGRSTSQLVD